MGGGGVMIYVRENIPCRQILFHDKPNGIEVIFFELNLRKNKWILMGGYNPAKEKALYFSDHVTRGQDKLMADNDNMLIIGDFCELYDLENLIKQPTCYKNADSPSSIDILLTNRKNSFQNSIVRPR